MPCMSYDTNWANDSGNSDVKRLKAEADKLARIACAAMSELEKMGKEDFLILKNEEVGTWWAAHKEADRKAQAAKAEKERRERVKREALDRLTDEEKELLGLSPKKTSAKKHKKYGSNLVRVEKDNGDYVMDYEAYGEWSKEENEDIGDMLVDLKEQYLKVFEQNDKRWKK